MVVIDHDPHRYTLGDLHEVAGGVIRRQQAELGSGGRRYTLHAAMHGLVIQRIDGKADRLPQAHVGHLGFFHVGDDPASFRHQCHQLRAGIDVSPEANTDLPQLTVTGRHDAGVVQVDTCQLNRRLGVGDRSLQ